MDKVCVMGLGYIGLPTASFLGTKGYQVVGVDISPKIVDTINKGEIHISEPDLDVLVKSAVQSGNLTAALTPTEADIFILAVPTPLTAEKKTGLNRYSRGDRGDLSLSASGQPCHIGIHEPGRDHGYHCRRDDPGQWFQGER